MEGWRTLYEMGACVASATPLAPATFLCWKEWVTSLRACLRGPGHAVGLRTPFKIAHTRKAIDVEVIVPKKLYGFCLLLP